MHRERFNPRRWQRDKYGDIRLSPLAPAEYQDRLQHFVDIINGAILQAQEEFRSQFNSRYDVIAAGIYGSWARGNPHKISDLDLFTVSSIYPAGLGRDFAERLDRKRIGIKIDYFGNLTYTNQQAARDFFRDPMFRSGVIVVSPYDQVVTALTFHKSRPKKIWQPKPRS